jgi:hypothetical protein
VINTSDQFERRLDSFAETIGQGVGGWFNDDIFPKIAALEGLSLAR